MGEKILYILGAGASAQALPIARSYRKETTSLNDPPDIPGLAYELGNFDWAAIRDNLDVNEVPLINGLDQKFKELAERANEFGDVDTYAKYLNLVSPKGPDLKELKKTLSLYFSIKQKLKQALDRRYVPWLVSVMNSNQFPDSIKILTWNYDFQVQLALVKLGSALEDVQHSSGTLDYSPGGIIHYPNLEPAFKNFGDMSLVHLNGIAGYVGTETSIRAGIFQHYYQNLESIDELLNKKHFLEPLLHFAWEGSSYHTKLLDQVIALIDRTTILVVIGYSFPFFNREIDKKIFEKLNEASTKFRKIYYQDPVLDGQQLKAQFGLADNFDIVHIPQTDRFHIPFEY